MAPKRVAVLDNNGVVVNHILIENPIPRGYWPGYGRHFLPLDGPMQGTKDSGLDVLNLTPSRIPQIGDHINKSTGEVTPWVPKLIDAKDEKGDPILDEVGQPVKWSEAPTVKMARDVPPKIPPPEEPKD